MVSNESFELPPELKSEIDASYDAVESGEDKGLTHKAYRKEMDHSIN